MKLHIVHLLVIVQFWLASPYLTSFSGKGFRPTGVLKYSRITKSSTQSCPSSIQLINGKLQCRTSAETKLFLSSSSVYSSATSEPIISRKLFTSAQRFVHNIIATPVSSFIHFALIFGWVSMLSNLSTLTQLDLLKFIGWIIMGISAAVISSKPKQSPLPLQEDGEEEEEREEKPIQTDQSLNKQPVPTEQQPPSEEKPPTAHKETEKQPEEDLVKFRSEEVLPVNDLPPVVHVEVGSEAVAESMNEEENIVKEEQIIVANITQSAVDESSTSSFVTSETTTTTTTTTTTRTTTEVVEEDKLLQPTNSTVEILEQDPRMQQETGEQTEQIADILPPFPSPEVAIPIQYAVEQHMEEQKHIPADTTESQLEPQPIESQQMEPPLVAEPQVPEIFPIEQLVTVDLPLKRLRGRPKTKKSSSNKATTTTTTKTTTTEEAPMTLSAPITTVKVEKELSEAARKRKEKKLQKAQEFAAWKAAHAMKKSPPNNSNNSNTMSSSTTTTTTTKTIITTTTTTNNNITEEENPSVTVIDSVDVEVNEAIPSPVDSAPTTSTDVYTIIPSISTEHLLPEIATSESATSESLSVPEASSTTHVMSGDGDISFSSSDSRSTMVNEQVSSTANTMQSAHEVMKEAVTSSPTVVSIPPPSITLEEREAAVATTSSAQSLGNVITSEQSVLLHATPIEQTDSITTISTELPAPIQKDTVNGVAVEATSVHATETTKVITVQQTETTTTTATMPTNNLDSIISSSEEPSVDIHAPITSNRLSEFLHTAEEDAATKNKEVLITISSEVFHGLVIKEFQKTLDNISTTLVNNNNNNENMGVEKKMMLSDEIIGEQIVTFLSQMTKLSHQQLFDIARRLFRHYLQLNQSTALSPDIFEPMQQLLNTGRRIFASPFAYTSLKEDIYKMIVILAWYQPPQSALSSSIEGHANTKETTTHQDERQLRWNQFVTILKQRIQPLYEQNSVWIQEAVALINKMTETKIKRLTRMYSGNQQVVQLAQMTNHHPLPGEEEEEATSKEKKEKRGKHVHKKKSYAVSRLIDVLSYEKENDYSEVLKAIQYELQLCTPQELVPERN